ncbi:dihydrofolate reductase family protein [Chryseobacterium sp.]|uniref:dihydrofolate reductase family protein n=1 Tax=Chryseobacterium sp. TaxID=1871047 RepID=UPI003219FA24
MKKIILDLATTLDGFIEGPNGEIDWCIMDDDMNFDGFISGIDTIFYGRVSYDAWGNYQPDENATPKELEFWKTIHAKKKVVFSSQYQEDERATFIHSDLVEKVSEIKKQDGKDIWLYGGESLIKTFVQYNLVDVYRISIHPIVLGSGKPLFEKMEDLEKRLNLKLVETNVFESGTIQFIYHL